MYFEYRSFEDMNRLIIDKLHIFPHDIDLIVGIPRSGMLPANLIALYLNKPFTDIDSFIEGKIYASGERGTYIDIKEYRNILIVDDSINSGNALQKAKSKLTNMTKKFHLEYAVVFSSTKGSHLIDYYCEIIDYPRIFQWNLFHHPSIIPQSCFDIDGVLCKNPPIDDDGPIYTEYIMNAIPLYIPSVEVDTLITCRLEKYRKATEEWLAKWNVKYKHLIMLNLKTKEERISWGKHGKYKGEIYKKTKNILFVESSLAEAIQISKISRKPVFCIETFDMINANILFNKIKYSFSTRMKFFIKKRLRIIINKF